MRKLLLFSAGVIISYAAIFVFDSYFHPLAKLGDSISIGENYSAVKAKFDQAIAMDTSLSLQQDSTDHILSGEEMTGAEQLCIRHDRILMDVQLQVLFDKDRRVQKVLLKSG